ncbi:MAG: hypothetical protein EOO73_11775 [Myxococcales bacterium]|nr:MAG: hypothetical protein EOO73_11775 [Myxococcales bacterium]
MLMPTICSECWRVQLASPAEVQGGAFACTACGADVRVVPGRSFPDSERAAFEELSSIVAEGSVTPMEARSYASHASHVLESGAYRALLAELSVRLPGLLPHEVAAGKNSAAQHNVVSRLKAIFDALGSARGASSEYAIVAEPTSPRVARK